MESRKDGRTLSACIVRFLLSGLLCMCLSPSYAQKQPLSSVPIEEEGLQVSSKVHVKPSVVDDAIRNRIENILTATDWYEKPSVEVKEGVVFLQGKTKSLDHKQWASKLAKNTEDVVAVVNQMEIMGPSWWDIQQMTAILSEQWLLLFRALPFFLFAVIVLAFTFPVARFFAKHSRKSLQKRGLHPLLSDVIGRAIALLCFLLGLYFILRIVGLTTIAFTVIGGTGVLGIVLGIAFRDITENVLASILLSVQKPFKKNDLIKVDALTGYVQGLTIRATVLMTPAGHEVQIPNATVYKSNIQNFTSNPNFREDFIIGIGYEDAISYAQKVALKILESHPAVLKEPEPWVLVHELAPETVHLRIYFWLDVSQYHWLKVKSSVIRLVKRAYQDAGISMPGPELALRFHENVPVQILKQEEKQKPAKREKEIESSEVATQAEGDLSSEGSELEQQARCSKLIEEKENLLR